MDKRGCWICDDQFVCGTATDGFVISIECPRCGQYGITESLYASEFPFPKAFRYRMSYWSRQRTLEGSSRTALHENAIRHVGASLPDPQPWEKPDRLLISLAKLSSEAAEWLVLDWERDISLACARKGVELRFYMRALTEQGYVEDKRVDKPTFRLLPRGWHRFNELRQQTSDSRIGFVAMSFSDEMLDLWEPVFAKAINEAGFTAERSMVPEHNNRIDVSIMAAIKRARFLVADVTDAKPGVYFEAGYAVGLGLPVIWTCKQSRMVDMHFDTRQYAHILWTDGSDLKRQLSARIFATI